MQVWTRAKQRKAKQNNAMPASVAPAIFIFQNSKAEHLFALNRYEITGDMHTLAWHSPFMYKVLT